jgi:hypothetical protein
MKIVIDFMLIWWSDFLCFRFAKLFFIELADEVKMSRERGEGKRKNFSLLIKRENYEEMSEMFTWKRAAEI